jgi:predicted dehydrogenase
MMTDSVPVAVVGCGNMGANHVRVYSEMTGADLVEVVEPDIERAAEIRDEYPDTRVVAAVEELETATAATVAVPNHEHRTVALDLLSRDMDVLVEKPLATTVGEASDIVAAARDHDAVLQVGHIEQFNPAVQTLRELLTKQDIIALEAHRLGPFNDHLSGESVVVDLMIHDLDLITSLVDSQLGSINAMGATPRSDRIDHAVAQLKFENGVLGVATASHVTHGKVRKLEVTTHDALISLDYRKQDIVVQRRGREETTTLLGRGGYRTETVTETPYVRTREPLRNQLEHFLDCVRTREQPLVSGQQGLEAVRITNDVTDRIETDG